MPPFHGQPAQCLTTTSVKKFVLTSTLNLLWQNSRLLPRILALVAWEETGSHLTATSCQELQTRPPLGLLLQTKQPLLPQLLLTIHFPVPSPASLLAPAFVTLSTFRKYTSLTVLTFRNYLELALLSKMFYLQVHERKTRSSASFFLVYIAITPTYFNTLVSSDFTTVLNTQNQKQCEKMWLFNPNYAMFSPQ